MGLFQNNSKPHTAEEYRKSAQAHLNAAKTMFLTFVKTGVIMVTGITVIIVFTLSWFVSNTSVTGSHTSISANDGKRYLLATKASEQQGIYDDSSSYNILLNALKYFNRVSSKTEVVQGLPEFSSGASSSTYENYIIGDAENISLRVNTTSNVNNVDNGDNQYNHIGPGAKGKITFYIIPLVDGDNTAHFTISLTPYEIDNKGTAKASSNEALIKLLYGHILLFNAIDNDGYYSDQIIPEVSDEKVTFAFSKTHSWTKDNPVEITLYWVWPYRFENIVYPGQKDSIFKEERIDANDPYNMYCKWMNEHQNMIVYKNENQSEISFSQPSSSMTNADFVKWSQGYNKADQLIGDKVAYFVWTISTDD